MSKMNDVSIVEAAKLLKIVISDAFKNNKIPSNICIEGPPGVGKSGITNNLPEVLAPVLNVDESQIVVIDVRLGAMEASDVQGIPFVCDGEMKFSTPEWFPEDDGKYYILLMDELMNCAQSVQHAAYRLILDRSIHNGKVLPDRCAVVGLGNRKEDKTGAKPLLPAAANRFALHMSITKFRDSLDYMVQKRFDSSIVAFLEYNSDAIYRPPVSESAFPTPRSWEFVNRHLTNSELVDDEFLLNIAVSGAVGSVTAAEFLSFREYNSHLPDWSRIRQGDQGYHYKVNTSDTALMFSLGTAIAFELIDALNGDKFDEIDNLCDVILDHLPSEIIIVTIRNIKRDMKAAAKMPRSKKLFEHFKKIAAYVR